MELEEPPCTDCGVDVGRVVACATVSGDICYVQGLTPVSPDPVVAACVRERTVTYVKDGLCVVYRYWSQTPSPKFDVKHGSLGLLLRNVRHEKSDWSRWNRG